MTTTVVSISDAPETDIPTAEPITEEPTAEPITGQPTDMPSEAPSSADASTVPDITLDPALTGSPNETDVPKDIVHVAIGDADMPARDTMPIELYGVDEKKCEEWFADAVFIGDSLTIGWRNYNNKMLETDPYFFGQTRFFCEGSYGVGHALEPISADSLHPVYAGSQQYVWDAISLMGAQKVFLLFGLNDLSIYDVDGTINKYESLVNNIRNTNPGVELYIISAMYMYRGSERPKLNNANLYKLNCLLAELCNKNGYEFINIASHLIDENGFVPDEFSSDQYVHQTYAAYAVWADILRSVAARHINGIGPVVFDLPKA